MHPNRLGSGKEKKVKEEKKIYLCPLRGCACEEGKCKWWVNVYTTEGTPVACCAIEALAMKNDEGRYQV